MDVTNIGDLNPGDWIIVHRPGQAIIVPFIEHVGISIKIDTLEIIPAVSVSRQVIRACRGIFRDLRDKTKPDEGFLRRDPL
jgi:hypothetical protein